MEPTIEQMHPFRGMSKIPRLFRPCLITEKLDGTNASIFIPAPTSGIDLGGQPFLVGRSTRWITPSNDNHGFAQWALAHADELLTLGPGRHFGEWWGFRINRGYGQTNANQRQWSLFDTLRYMGKTPSCVSLVPTLFTGPFTTDIVNDTLQTLRQTGSKAAEGYMKPEGVVVLHLASGHRFKVTLEGDGIPKSQQPPAVVGQLALELS